MREVGLELFEVDVNEERSFGDRVNNDCSFRKLSGGSLDEVFPNKGYSNPSSLKGKYNGESDDKGEENTSKSKQDEEGKD